MLIGTSERLQRFVENSSFLRHYLWKYRRWVSVGLLALVIVDCLEILPPIFLKSAVDIVVERKAIWLLGKVALAYLATSLVQGICRYVWRMYLIRSSIFSGRDLRNQYVGHLFDLSVSFFEKTQMGSLMSLATNDVEAVRLAIGSGLLVLADALFYLMTIPVAMFFLSPRLTFLACIPLPLIPWIVLRNERKIHDRFERVQECFGKISAIAQENLSGIRVVKAFAQEKTQMSRLEEAGKEFANLSLELAKVQTAMGPTMDLSMSIGMILLLYFGGKWVIDGDGSALSLGTFVAFQRYIQKMVWPMAALGMAVNYFQRSASSTQRLKNIFKVSTDVPNLPCYHIQDLSLCTEGTDPTLQREVPLSSMTGRLEFRNLHFAFPGSNVLALKDINLVIEPGENIAIVGTIGSGKSALLSLIPRLYPLSKGMLFIDGIDINDWPIETLRKNIGYVTQDVFLFRGTVSENVAFGLHDCIEENVAPITIEKATQLSSIHDEILRLEAGYLTRLGEQGMRLSGGQKQRLTVARALAKQPSILILDDALSAVDVQTEEKIIHQLKSRSGRNTEFVSGHRISTIKNADRIVVIRGGKTVQIGTHSQLIKIVSGDYYRLYEQQKLKEEYEEYAKTITEKRFPLSPGISDL